MILLLAACTGAPPASDGVDSAPVDSGDTYVNDFVPPAWVPDFVHSAEAPEASEGGVVIVPLIQSGGGGIVALGARGDVVWAFPETAEGLNRPPLRARLSADGKDILYNHMAPNADALCEIVRVPLDGGTPSTVGMHGGHTDFVEYTPGGYATLGWEIRAFDDRKIMGDTIVELSPEGVERTVWSVFDDFSPDLSQTYASLYPEDPTIEDWSHINGISYDADEDAYYVTMTFNNGVAKVDRASGTMEWFIGNPDAGDFSNPDADKLLELPHSVERIDGGVLAFSRGRMGVPGECSEAVELTIDQDAREVRRAWNYTSPDCISVSYLGGAERLPGGNTLITWTTAGQIDQITPDGRQAWTVNTAIGNGIGFTTWVPELPR